MTYPLILSVGGLALDIVGVILVYRFAFLGDPGGEVMALESYDERKAKRSRRIGHFGLLLIIAGFGLQMAYSIVTAEPMS